MDPKFEIKYIIVILLIFSLIISIDAGNHSYGFFYDNYEDEIIFYNEQSFISKSYPLDNLLTNTRKEREYFSSAKENRFKIEYYSCPDAIPSSPLTLIKASFNISEPEKMEVKEVILDLSKADNKKAILPDKYYDEFTIEQNKTATVEGRKNRKTIIYDTFGFNIKSKNNFNFKIIKLLLVNFRKNKLNYLVNLSGDVKNTYDGNNNTFDIYLKNMPENFDLYITFEIFNKNWSTTGERILVVQNGFNNPNYNVEHINPNKNMFIISIIFIIIALIITVVFILLKFIFD